MLITKKYFFYLLIVTYIILGWGSFSNIREFRSKIKIFFLMLIDEAEGQIKIKNEDE